MQVLGFVPSLAGVNALRKPHEQSKHSVRACPVLCSRRVIVRGCCRDGQNSAESQERSSKKPANARSRRQTSARRFQAVSEEIREELKDTNKTPVKISIPYDVWKPLGLSPKLKLVRVFVDESSTANLAHFRQQIRDQLVRLFPALGDSNPRFNLLPDGEAFDLKHSGETIMSTSNLVEAMEAVEQSESQLTLTLLIKSLPQLNVPEHVPEPQRLIGLKAESCQQVKVLSFYRFVDIDAAEFVFSRLKRVFPALGVFGRVYIAPEGINAQLSVPESLFRSLEISMMTDPVKQGGDEMPDVAKWAERWVPREIRGVFLNVDRTVDKVDAPFVDLRIKIRHKVLADGFERPLDWSQAGKAVGPEEWHESLTSSDDKELMVLDCRNKYESEVGHFKNAIPLDTDKFRDSWTRLEKTLQNTNRDRKILTYCTGGIRCVKVGAYLEQKMGFTNVERLEGGIVAYSKYLREKPELESQFSGVNYVFDLRLGERVTEEVLAKCWTCGTPCDTQTDCRNVRCKKPFASRHFVQCPDCAKRLLGCCSDACRTVVQNELDKCKESSADASQSLAKSSTDASSATREGERADEEDPAALLNAYSEQYSSEEPSLLAQLREETSSLLPYRSHMVCGPVIGKSLALIITLAGGRRVLELGTFTGYSALWMASALPKDGLLITCDVDQSTVAIARKYCAKSDHGKCVDCRVTSANDLLNELAEEGVEPFDVVFMDNNKAKYIEYYEKLLDSGLLRRGGVLVVDNVLFKGSVPYYHVDASPDVPTPLSKQLRKRRSRSLREANKLGSKIHHFNAHVAQDPRTEQVLLPVRDGIMIVRRI